MKMADLSLAAAASSDPDLPESATGPSLFAAATRALLKEHVRPITQADPDESYRVPR